MKFHRLVLLLLLPMYFISCKPQQKVVNYLEGVNDSTGRGPVTYPELKIQKNDRLSIIIFSLSTKPEISDAIYNQPAVGTGGETAGYLVDNNGDIIHHRLGLIHVEGLTKNEVANEVKKRLTMPVELLKDPTVVVRIENFTVTLLGEVGRQGPIPVEGEKITILEAIGLAGGIAEMGKKTNVKVIREQNGQRETGYIDLSSKDIFQSPYYNLLQNDLIVVDVDDRNRKYKDEEQARLVQKISFALTLVTVAATLSSIFIRN